MSDPLALNKILAGFLCACLILIGSGKFASFLQNYGHHDTHSEHHTGHHDQSSKEVSNAFPIFVQEDSIELTKTSKNILPPVLPILALLKDANISKGQKISKKCVACHSFNQGGPNKVGPNLWNIVNRRMASVDGFKYSKSLAAFDEGWNYINLNKFLTKPKDYIKGTKMNYAGLKKESDRANIISWLRTLSDSPVPFPSQEEINAELNSQ